MKTTVNHDHDQNSWQLAGFLLLSICLNALGNGLTVALNLGSALWTASAVNLSHTTGIPLGNFMMLLGLVIIAVNALILGKLEWRRVLGNLIFMTPFSYLVQWVASLMRPLPFMNWSLPAKFLLDFFGVSLVGTAISLYQRVNIAVHPTDDMMQIVRFRIFRGNSTIAQWVTFMVPLALIGISFLISGKVWAVNLGTLFSLLFQGTVVGFMDRHLFPSLHHRHLDAIQTAK